MVYAGFIVIRLIVRLVMMFAVFAVTYVFSSRFSERAWKGCHVLIIVAVEIVLVVVTGNVSSMVKEADMELS